MPHSEESPFVSILTPVYNGERFLAECIESVLAQDYSNWEYIIVNNCSTDRTLAVAMSYAEREHRIRIVNNTAFVNCEENHNNAFRQISSRSVYTKVVSADDALLPGALRKMVRFAALHPSVGIVGSYQRSRSAIKWKGLSQRVTVLPGRQVCRMALLADLNVFGNPTSTLYRSDLVRRADSFFPHSKPHADTSACFAHLKSCEYGFIHEVLSMERVHDVQVSAPLVQLNAAATADLDILSQYGRDYLNDSEFATQLNKLLTAYYAYLGRCVFKMKGSGFWRFHSIELARIGYTLDRRRVFIAAIHEFTSELRHPLEALRKLLAAFSRKKSR